MAADKETTTTKRTEKSKEKKDKTTSRVKKTTTAEELDTQNDFLATICPDLPASTVTSTAPVSTSTSSVPLQPVVQSVAQPVLQPEFPLPMMPNPAQQAANYAEGMPQHYVLDHNQQFVPAAQPQQYPPGMVYYTQPPFPQDNHYDDYGWYVPQVEEPIPEPAPEAPMETQEETGSNDGSEDSSDDLLQDILGELTKTEDGEPIATQLATLVDKIWSVNHDLKPLYDRNRMPSNLAQVKRVNLNVEILAAIKAVPKARDFKLRSIQTSLTRSAYPIVRLVDSMMKGITEKKTLVTLAMDSLKTLASANTSVNTLRKELLTSAMPNKYAKLSTTDAKFLDPETLFGRDLNKQLTTLTEVSAISTQISRTPMARVHRGRGANQYQPPHPQSGYGFHPYARQQQQRGSRRPAYARPYGANFGTYKHYQLEVTHKVVLPPIPVSSSLPFYDTFAHTASQSQITIANDLSRSVCYSKREGAGETCVKRKTSHQVTSSMYNGELKLLLEDQSTFKAGQLQYSIQAWENLTSDITILRAIKGFKIDFDSLPVQTLPSWPIRVSDAERSILQREIALLMTKQVVQPAQHVPGEFVSSIFLTEKKEADSFRFILNLKKLNEFVTYHHFKMDSLAAIKNLVQPGCFFTRLDFSDAYYSVNVHKDHRKYLRFIFNENLYEFKALPNGLSSAPRTFTKIMKVPLSHLREQYGYKLVGYIDDIILTQQTEEDMHEATKVTIELLLELGFTISIKKSVVIPTQKIDFLGFTLDSINMTTALTPEKAHNIRLFCEKTVASKEITIRHFAKLLGMMNATEQGNKFCQLHTRRLEIQKTEILRANAGNYDRNMKVSDIIRSELRWWIDNIESIDKPVRNHTPELVILTDASLKGWGCHIKASDTTTGGRWSLDEAKLHINVLELMAVLNSLKSLAYATENKHIRIMTDNTTTMQCINNQGSARSPQCNEVAMSLWQWAIPKGIWLSAAHIPGVDNIEADKASREFNDNLEWSLDMDYFNTIVDFFGKPDMDLFASRLNHKLEQYCAWQPDPSAQVIDAFTIDWSNLFFYMFPPFSMIGPCLAKLQQDGGRALLIAPWWPTQPWTSALAEMLVETPRYFLVRSRTLQLVHEDTKHPLAGKLVLLACSISGAPSECKAFRLKSSKPCFSARGTHRTHSIHHTSPSGMSIVSHGATITFAPLLPQV